MDLIDGFFAELSGSIRDILPAGPISSLISEGIIPGIGGVVIFIPQIAMLFGFLAILEDTGYMSRVVFLDGSLDATIWTSWQKCCPINLWCSLCDTWGNGR